MRTQKVWITALVTAVAMLIAGCGSSSSSSTSTPSSTPATAPSTGAAPTSTGGSSGAASNPNVAAAVAQCKSRIAAAPNLSSDAKSKLQGLCDQAASGNQAQVQKTLAQVCQEIVKQSVPAAQQAQVLATCPKS